MCSLIVVLMINTFGMASQMWRQMMLTSGALRTSLFPCCLMCWMFSVAWTWCLRSFFYAGRVSSLGIVYLLRCPTISLSLLCLCGQVVQVKFQLFPLLFQLDPGLISMNLLMRSELGSQETFPSVVWVVGLDAKWKNSCSLDMWIIWFSVNAVYRQHRLN